MEPSVTYIHSEKVSLISRLLQFMFALFGVKKGGDLTKAAHQSTSAQVPTPVPKSIAKNYNVRCSAKHARPTWTISPKENASDKVILYLHGGAYLFTIKQYHWNFAAELLAKTNATIVIPDYPLAPDSSCEDAIDFIGHIYEELLGTFGSRNIVLMGDSSGAGLALGFAMTLKNDRILRPSQIILLSPWLDVTMTNEGIMEADKNDKVLAIEPLRLAGKLFAGKLDLKDYRVSPIYGDLSGLGQVSVFIGTHDLFIADCRKFKTLCDSSGVHINYFEYPKMFHGWFIVKSLKEATVAVNQISSLITNESVIKRSQVNE
ncbi:MAG TPA: alpha/beta hydrolase [Flavobacteriales bacterium]|nr:alpha/beta hydrolase [Flavobacteriales bacterium]